MASTSNFGQRPQTEGLTVYGEATRSAQPDIVELALDVHSAAPVAAQALRDNAMKVMHVGQAVTAIGIGQQDVQAGAATIYPIYPPPLAALPHPAMPQLPGPGMSGALAPFGMTDGPPIAGYHVISFLKLSLSDVNRLGDVVDAASRAGAGLSGGFLFRLRDEPAIRRGLLEEAGRDAREKAGALASAVGKGLGDPVSVVEDYSVYQVGPYYNGHRGGPYTLTPAGTLARMPFTPGELTLHARVNVTYRLQ